jgi:beta-lactam-binding protein with PASTA domain
MNAVIMKLLSKNPEDRYADADALAEDLWRVRSGPPAAAGAAAGASEARTVEAPTNRLAPPSRRAAPASARPKRSRAPFVLAGLLLLLGLAGVGLALAQGIGSSNNGVEVPSVEGMPRDEAVTRLESAGFQTEVQTGEGGGEAGTVTEQSPPGGERAQEGSTVTLTVAASTVAVPDVMGQSFADAEAELQDAGLAVGSTYDVQGDAAAGVVLEQGVIAGTQVEPGTGVDLGLSTGPAQPASASPDSSPDASAQPEPTSPSSAPSDPSADASADASASPEAGPQNGEGGEAAEEAREEEQKAREEASEEEQKAREEASEEAEGPKAAKGKGKE